uniref:Uncharacterized protein n=1 Tax=Hyaloperonospora arabidopsidis (strain Emoy2) TaxID=559515 RepID=M4BZ96_HYAAE
MQTIIELELLDIHNHFIVSNDIDQPQTWKGGPVVLPTDDGGGTITGRCSFASDVVDAFPGGEGQQLLDEPGEVGRRYVADYDGQGLRTVGDYRVGSRRHLGDSEVYRGKVSVTTIWRETSQSCRIQGW